MDTNTDKKYISLSQYFSNADCTKIVLTFNEIEQIMGHQLPNAAYLNKSWWKKTKAPAKHFRAWANAGYTVQEIENGRSVTFVKATSSSLSSSAHTSTPQDILLVRQAGHDDARSFITLQQTVEAESKFMLYGKNERSVSTQSVRKRMAEWKKSGRSAIFIAILNGNHAGYLLFIGNEAERAAHRASLVIGVLSSCQKKGVGFALLKKAEDWARQHDISRLELTVASANTAACSLYEKAGYEVEGIRKQALLIEGNYHDELYMAKLLK